MASTRRNWTACRRALWLALVGVGVPGVSHSTIQERVGICEVTLSMYLTIPLASRYSRLPTILPHVTEGLRPGTYLFVSDPDSSNIWELHADGKAFKWSTIPRNAYGGQRRPVQIRSGSDDVVVLDASEPSIVTVDSRGHIVSEMAVPGHLYDIALTRPNWTLNARIPTLERAGFALHQIEGRSKFGRSIDDLGPIVLAGPSSDRVLVAPGPDGLLRSLSPTRALLRVHDSAGAIVMVAHLSPAISEHDGIADMYVGANGLVWLLTTDKRGQTRVEQPGPVLTRKSLDLTLSAHYHSHIDLIDPVSGRIVGSGNSDRLFYGFTRDGRLISLEFGHEDVELALWLVQAPGCPTQPS